jgi:general secretion pathway protein I
LSRKMSPEQEGEGGFTMIEAVVTLALVTVVLAAIGYLVAANTRGVRVLEQHVALMETARLVATGIPRSSEPLPDNLAGEMSGHRWQIRQSPFFDGVPAVPESRFMPQRVELRVQSPSGAILLLETVRLQNMSGR